MLREVLVVDDAARGHALAHKLIASPRVGAVYVAPGNGGTESFANNVPIDVTDVDGLVRFALQNNVHLTVVGSEYALAAGIVDKFERASLSIVGPKAAAAEIETSKSFAKGIMAMAGVATARWSFFTDYDQALAYAQSSPMPVVIKFDGLAGGAGSFVCTDVLACRRALEILMVEKLHGEGGVIIEDYLDGREASFQVFVDLYGNVLMLPPVCDYKRRFEGDEGPNTGSMGSVGPVPDIGADTVELVKTTIVLPVLQQLANQGRPFVGCLFVNVMLTAEGPKVLEFNARPGDSETQVLMRLLASDLYDLLWACLTGSLDEYVARWRSGYAAAVNIVTYEYPKAGAIDLPIVGLDAAAQVHGGFVYHGDTRVGHEGMHFTTGPRVLTATCRAARLDDAVNGAQDMAAWLAPNRQTRGGLSYRSDIGLNLIIGQI